MKVLFLADFFSKQSVINFYKYIFFIVIIVKILSKKYFVNFYKKYKNYFTIIVSQLNLKPTLTNELQINKLEKHPN